jgi:hypothetical protein
MYQQVKPMVEGAEAQCIKRTADNAFIPFDPANTDYQAYLKWLEEGNEVLPADEPPVDEPSVDEPLPAVEPLPVDEPPVDEPPVDEPPADEPPVDEPPADEVVE